jgi:hypothetical protein
VLLAAALYAPGVFLGYGADLDSYGVVDAARAWLSTGIYTPSRHPGFLVHELATGVLDRLGGSVLANLGTLAMALVAVGSFHSLLRRFAVPSPRLVTAGMIVHPVFWAAASCTIDYVWALALILAGFRMLAARRFGGAGVLLGLAIGARLTSALAAGALLAAAFLSERDARRRVGIACGLASILGALAYVPAWLAAGRTFDFLAPALGTPEHWSAGLRAGRFAYKNLYFWGLPAALVLGAFAIRVRAWRPRASEAGPARPLLLVSLAIVLAYEALFAAYPLEIEYLLPILPFMLFLLGRLASRRLVAAYVIAAATYAVVSVNVARPNVADWATSATVGLWIEPGYVLRDWTRRFELRGCSTVADWHAAAP